MKLIIDVKESAQRSAPITLSIGGESLTVELANLPSSLVDGYCSLDKVDSLVRELAGMATPARENKINIIKMVRALSGVGLKEAKDLVDKYVSYDYDTGSWRYSQRPETEDS